MNPGETRTVSARDKHGDILKTITITRTTRPYVFDLADAYNAGRENEKYRWHVVGRDLQFGDPSWRDDDQWREMRRINDEWHQHLRFGGQP